MSSNESFCDFYIELLGFLAKYGELRHKVPKTKFDQLAGVCMVVHNTTCKSYIGYSENLHAYGNKVKSNLNCGKLDKVPELVKLCETDPGITILYLPLASKQDAIKVKQAVLDKFLPTGCLFNQSTDAVKSGLGWARSEKLVENLRKCRTGTTLSETTRKRISRCLKGRKLPEETRAKMSASALSRNTGKACMIEFVVYPSLNLAAKDIGVEPKTIKARCLSKNYPGYQFVENTKS